MEKCRSCLATNSFEDKEISYPRKAGGRIVIFEHVPALVCSQCGETLFRAETLKLMEDLIAGERPPSRTETVPVYDLAQVA